jgi:hypothetical protein
MSVNRKVPLRTCIGCGEQKNKKELIRIVKTTENEILIDRTGKLNGRGAYICESGECLEKAIKNKGIERAFKMAIDPLVYEELKKQV